MLNHINKPAIAAVSSLSALCMGAMMWIGMLILPEQQSMAAFFILFPATLLFAILGYLLGAFTQNSRLSILGYLIGGGVLLAILVIFMLPAF